MSSSDSSDSSFFSSFFSSTAKKWPNDQLKQLTAHNQSNQIPKTYNSLAKETLYALKKTKNKKTNWEFNTPAAGAAPPAPPVAAVAAGVATAPPAGTEANLERPVSEKHW